MVQITPEEATQAIDDARKARNDGIRSLFYSAVLLSCLLIPILTSPDTSQYRFIENQFYFIGTEIWDLYAILLTLGFSIILLSEPDEKQGIRNVLISLFIIIFCCLAGIIALGIHWSRAYHIVLLITVLGLAIADWLMYAVSAKRLYLRLLFFVDIPIFLSFLLLTWYTDLLLNVPNSKGDLQIPEFFSGAIAFQLIFGNLLILSFRSYDEIMNEPKNVVIRVSLVFTQPFRKTYRVIMDTPERRKTRKQMKEIVAGQSTNASNTTEELEDGSNNG